MHDADDRDYGQNYDPDNLNEFDYDGVDEDDQSPHEPTAAERHFHAHYHPIWREDPGCYSVTGYRS